MSKLPRVGKFWFSDIGESDTRHFLGIPKLFTTISPTFTSRDQTHNLSRKGLNFVASGFFDELKNRGYE